MSGQVNVGRQEDLVAPPKHPYTISKETTYFTGPLKPDGSLDFIAAVNEHFAKGVTRENNAAAIILPLLDHPWTWGSDERRAAVLGAMGLKPEEYLGRPTLLELRSFSKAPGGDKLENVDAEYNAALGGFWTDDELPLMRRWLDVNREPMSQIARATKRDKYFVPFVSSDDSDSLVRILLEHTQCQREVARMFVIRANLHMAHGRWKDAWDDIQTAMALGRLVGQSPTLVEGLVGIAICGIACDAANRFVVNAAPEDVDWEALRSHWNVQPVFDVGQSLGVTERAMLIQLMCSISDERGPDATLQEWLSRGQGETVAEVAARNASAKLVSGALHNMLTSGEVHLDDALRHSNRIYDRATEGISNPNPAARNSAFTAIEDQIQIVRGDAPDEPHVTAVLRVLTSQPQRPDEQFANVLLGVVFPATRSPMRAEMRMRASQSVVELSLAARALQLRTGHLPQSLHELEPFVDKDTFIQPSTGDPIAFRADDEGILIYHWSSDRIDNGGDIDGDNPKDWGIRIKK